MDASKKLPPEYVAQHIREALATDEEVGQLDIKVEVRDDTVLLSGHVPTEERREALQRCAEEMAPGWRIHNATQVSTMQEPGEMESLP